MKKKILVSILMGCLYGAAAWGIPVADGTVGSGEYTASVEKGGMTLYYTVTADSIFLAIRAKTSGWVAIGIGSDRMDKAVIFMGYDAGGTPAYAEQKGIGHGHSDLAAAGVVISKGLRESDGWTVMELALSRAKALAPGSASLPVIIAAGKADSFKAIHSSRGSVVIPVQ